ncbi:MAG: DHA2 family efflux MFS transporter permease subunit [Chloroflexi bacterium]|nr:DHA2 family efflux MFS transporter permease subunit [Chloroflexota bacterium]
MHEPIQNNAQQSGGLPYKWIVAIVVIFGLFMVILDTTIVNNAVSRLQTYFGASLSDVAWVSTGYTLTEGIGATLAPFLSARLGIKRFYMVLLALFTISSACCGLAWSLPVLITFRIIQGLAGASVMPMSITLLYSEFPPEERGAAMGLLGVPILFAPALGPTLGGYLVTYWSWQWVFFINLPVGVIGFFMALTYLRESRPQQGASFDFLGFIFAAICLGSLLYALDDAGTDGWGSAKVDDFLILGGVALTIFIVTELLLASNGKEPLLDLRLFRDRNFLGGNLATVMTTIALFGGLYLVPIYLQSLRGLTAYESGLTLLPQALAMMVSVTVGGFLSDKIGVKAVTIPGLAILGFALWRMSLLSTYTPLGSIQWLLILRGFGLGLCAQTASRVAMSTLRGKQLSQGSSLNSVIRSCSSAMGVAIMTTLVSNRRDFHYVRLAEQVTPNSPGAMYLQELTQMFISRGFQQAQAQVAAIQQMVQQVQQQAFQLAINDAFLFTVGIVILTVLLFVFVIQTPGPRVSASQGSAAPQQSKEAGKEAVQQEEEEPVFVH